MLYQEKTRRPARTLRHAFVALLGLVASAARRRSDIAYLDTLENYRLEDLGLRRTENGGYRFFD